MKYYKTHKQRLNKILKIIPKDVETVLDIGSRGDMFKENFKTTTIDIIEEATIKQDLNINQKIDLPDNSFDIVVLNQILEHLTDVEEIIKETKRVSKKYILIGLPNEVVLSNIIKILFGNHIGMGDGYNPYGHKHFFRIKTIEDFILRFFNNYKKKDYLFIGIGGSIIPMFIKNKLANKFPKLFAGHVYYLINNGK